MTEKERFLDHVLCEENQHETVALARALCPFAEEATDMQMLVCVAMVEAKGDMKLVAEEMGCVMAVIRRHCQSRLSQQILRKLAKHKLTGEGYLIAISNLMHIASSSNTSANARNNASKTLIELAEAEEARSGGGGDEDRVDLNNMTIHQLQSFVNTIKQDLVRLPAQIPGVLIDNQSN